MSNDERAIAEIHAWYGARSGVQTKLCFAQRLWYDLAKIYGFDYARLREECEIVIRHLKREIARDKRNVGALKPANFLQPDNFDADLAIARLELKRTNSKSIKPERKTAPAKFSVADDVPEDFRRGTIKEQMQRLRESLAQPKGNGRNE